MTIGFFAKTNLKKEKWIRGKGMFLKITHATGMGNQQAHSCRQRRRRFKYLNIYYLRVRVRVRVRVCVCVCACVCVISFHRKDFS